VAVRPLYGVAGDEAIDDDRITECFPQDRMQVNHGRDGERLAVETSTGQKVAVQLRDRGWPDSLDRHLADVRRDVEPDASPVVQQGPRLDLHRVAVDPLIEVFGDRDLVAADVLPTAGLHACLVAGGLGFVLGGESADPPRPAGPSLGVLDPDHVRPCTPALHDAIAELGDILAAALSAVWRPGGVGTNSGGHHAAVPSVRSLEMYSSRAASGMRRDPSIRIEATAPLAISS
jgi:hypothetical protein